MSELALEDILDGSDVVAEVVMMRAAENKCILIVEGDTDKRLFSCFVNSDRCDIVVANGKKYAVESMSEIDTRGIPGVLCVVDADFDRLTGELAESNNIIMTDDNDIEITLIRSQALDKVITEMASQGKIKSFKEAGGDIRVLVSELGHTLGAVRLVSLEKGLHLRFEGFRYRYIDRATMTGSLSDMLQEIINHSRKSALSVDEIAVQVEQCRQVNSEPWSLCCGHDLAVFVGKALQSLIGSKPQCATGRDEIESRLRIGFSRADLILTRVYDKIRAWEARNVPFECLISGV